jgi:mannonate dehydratase
MRIGEGQVNEITEPWLHYVKQLGLQDVQINCYHGSPHLPGEARWEYDDLVALRERVEAAGLRLAAIENVPLKFYDKIILGLPGRDEQIENMAATFRHMGRAGITMFGYHWAANGVWRTHNAVGRGDTTVSAFDMERAQNAPLTHGRAFTSEEIWDNFGYYMRAILPVVEEAGVRIALHPDDPPVPSLGGVARIFGSFDAFKRAMTEYASPNHGLEFCIGSWSEMLGPRVIDAIRHFGEQGKLFYIHFRDVQGTVPRFQECFVGEGNCNLAEIVQALKDVKFEGFMLSDHVPGMEGDTPWGHRGRAYAVGYLTALIEMAR